MTHTTYDSTPFPTAAATHDARRVEVRQLAGQGMSNRAVARRVGVSEATVRRWRRDDADETHDAISVVLDDDLHDDLNVLAEVGMFADAAIRFTVQLVADAVRSAWDYGDVARGAPLCVKATAVPGVLPPTLTGTRAAPQRPAPAARTTSPSRA